MSVQARNELANLLQFSDATQKPDLLDPSKTNTFLIQMLLDVAQRCPRPILITALTTDHPTVDGGPGTHGHTQGFAFDGWTATGGDPGVADLIRALAASPYVWTVGAGGAAKNYLSGITFPSDGKFIFFLDNNQDHVHAQAGNPNGQGLR
jgi:hypothetical protein